MVNKYFKLPLTTQHDYIFDADENIVMNSLVDDESTQIIIDKINNNKGKLSTTFSYHNDGFVYSDDYKVLVIRSWGRLTSVEGLTPDEAKKAQDDFGKMIINKLNE